MNDEEFINEHFRKLDTLPAPYATSPIKETVVVNASTLSEAKQLTKEKFQTITSFNKIMTEDGKSH